MQAGLDGPAVDSLVASNGEVLNNRVNTLDACYEVVKEKLDRLREEIRRIRINKQQEQLQESIKAKKRLSADATASGQLLVPPRLPGSNYHHNSVSPRSSPPGTKLKHRASAAGSNGKSRERHASSSTDEAEQSRKMARNRQSNVAKRSPKSVTKPKLAKQNHVMPVNDPSTTTTSGRECSESPPVSKSNMKERQKSPQNRPKPLKVRSHTMHESPHPVRLLAQANNGTFTFTTNKDGETVSDKIAELHGSRPSLTSSRSSRQELTPTMPKNDVNDSMRGSTMEHPSGSSRHGSIQSNSSSQMATSTVVLPQTALQNQNSTSHQRRPPRSFIIRTNATPEYDTTGSVKRPDQTKHSKNFLQTPLSTGHSMSVSPQTKCFVVQQSNVPKANGTNAEPSVTRSNSSSASASNYTSPLMKIMTSSERGDKKPNFADHFPPPRQFLIDKQKMPSIPTSISGSTPMLAGSSVNIDKTNSNNNRNNSSNSNSNSNSNTANNSNNANVVASKPPVSGGEKVKQQTHQASHDSSSYENLELSSNGSKMSNQLSSNSSTSVAILPNKPPVTKFNNNHSKCFCYL